MAKHTNSVSFGILFAAVRDLTRLVPSHVLASNLATHNPSRREQNKPTTQKNDAVSQHTNVLHGSSIDGHTSLAEK